MPMTLKMTIRETEDSLPSITESLARMNKSERLRLFSVYYQAKKMLLLHEASNVLDVGCGDGLFLKETHKILCKRGCAYVGIDISLRKLRLAKRRLRKLNSGVEAHFVLCEADYLPFKFSAFQIVSMVEVFEHFLDPRVAIIELATVVSHDGNVIITTPSALGVVGLMKKTFSFHNVAGRQTHLIIEGKKLPHRDFNYDEVACIVKGYFRPIRFYSFNIDPILFILRFLPYNFGNFMAMMFESHAEKMPLFFGSNFAILLQRK
jgi:ubiquinone/menaquinone biosynthesis C-methylase UbiE